MLALPGHTSEQRTANKPKDHLTGKAPYESHTYYALMHSRYRISVANPTHYVGSGGLTIVLSVAAPHRRLARSWLSVRHFAPTPKKLHRSGVVLSSLALTFVNPYIGSRDGRCAKDEWHRSQALGARRSYNHRGCGSASFRPPQRQTAKKISQATARSWRSPGGLGNTASP